MGNYFRYILPRISIPGRFSAKIFRPTGRLGSPGVSTITLLYDIYARDFPCTINHRTLGSAGLSGDGVGGG